MNRKQRAGVMPSVILINPKYPHNVGAALRACSCFDVAQLWWTGSRVTVDPVKGERLPREERMRGYRDVELCHDQRPFDRFGRAAVPVAVEVRERSECLTLFEHPDEAVYVFGPEDGEIPRAVLKLCHRFVHIPARHCLNLATAVAVVLASRRMWRQLQGLEPILPLGEMLRERRGGSTPALDSMGWDGK